MKALDKETAPETAGLLAAFVESLGRIAVNRADYGGFEAILTSLERVRSLPLPMPRAYAVSLRPRCCRGSKTAGRSWPTGR